MEIEEVELDQPAKECRICNHKKVCPKVKENGYEPGQADECEDFEVGKVKRA